MRPARALCVLLVSLAAAVTSSALAQDTGQHGWPPHAGAAPEGETATTEASPGASAWPAPQRDPAPGVGLPAGIALEQTMRPLTLPRLALRGDLSFLVLQPATGAADPRIAAALGLGAALGVTDDVELSVAVLPLQLVPSVAYLNPYVAGTFRLLHERDVQVALTAQIFVPVQSPMQGTLAGRLWWTAARSVQLRATLAYTGDLATTGAIAYAHTVSVGVDLVLQPLPSLYFVVGTGVAIPLSASAYVDVAKRFAIPLGFELGFTVPSAARTPIADIYLSFTFPELFVPGGMDPVMAQPWLFMAGARLFFTV